jgi:hypothetical protein
LAWHRQSISKALPDCCHSMACWHGIAKALAKHYQIVATAFPGLCGVSGHRSNLV